MIETTEAIRRITDLLGEGERLIAHVPTGEDDKAEYHFTIRVKDHPEVEGAKVLLLRYARLTKKPEWKGSQDTFMKNGMSFRDPDGSGDLAKALGRAFLATSAHQQNPDKSKAPVSFYLDP